MTPTSAALATALIPSSRANPGRKTNGTKSGTEQRNDDAQSNMKAGVRSASPVLGPLLPRAIGDRFASAAESKRSNALSTPNKTYVARHP